MKVHSPVVLDSLAECLRTCHWFKKDLRSFLLRAGVPDVALALLDWDGNNKRTIVRDLIDHLSSNPASGMELLDRLIDSVVEMDARFPHLRRLDDGVRLVEEAFCAQAALKDLLDKENIVERAERARREQRTESERVAAEVQERSRALEQCQVTFLELAASTDHQRRGLSFQDLLRDLFLLYDLEPRGSFSSPGEQIDGSIKLDGTVLLLEAKWTTSLSSPAEVRDFVGKVRKKIATSLGLMISMGGFTDEAIKEASSGDRFLVILMDGQDLAPIFQGLVDLRDVLRRKLRFASEKGGALHRIQ